MIKVILIHGNGGGTASDNWLPYVKEHLEQVGVTVIAQTFPDAVLARSSIDESRHIHEKLNTEYYEFTDRGHFGSDRDTKVFPECAAVLKKKLQF